MELELGKKIYQLRTEKGYTQETLANLLNVSCAAVSKWENDYAYPDITTLPILARIYDVSIDELLNFEKKLSEEQVNEMLQSLPDKFQVLSFDEAMNYTKELVRTYPNCEYLKLRISAAYMSLALLLGEEQLKVFVEYAKSLCKDILHTENLQYRQGAAVQLVTFLSMDEKYQEALDILLSIPKLADTLSLECTLYCQLEDYEKAKELLQTQLYTSINTIEMGLYSLIRIAVKQDSLQELPDYIHLMEEVSSLFHMDTVINSQLLYPFAKLKDKDNTLKYLKKYIKQLQDFDNLSTNLQRELSACTWFSNINLSSKNHPKGAMKQHIRSILEEMKYIDFIRNSPEYQELLSLIESV